MVLSRDVASGFCFHPFAEVVHSNEDESVPRARAREGPNSIDTNGVEGVLRQDKFEFVTRCAGTLQLAFVTGGKYIGD